ncbi:excitatory amino acid transporter 1 [Rhipicephalus sanguineus]|uniref:excitatory amino acid transporter 1 n=1 Tax=Rhipicephalus sanguineus TaxID=34632 RepID=UPI0020C36D20|nr:excitatory amino acid transporter 1 [Rhipicephalus sanguineus]
MAAGLVAGAALGFAIRATDNPWTKRQIVYVGFPGELFLRMMSGVTLPLISTSVVAALGSSRPPVLGRVGLCALALSLVCKCLAAAGALGLAAFLSPGNTVRLDVVETPRPNMSLSNVAIDRLLDFIRNLFPSNIIAAHIYTLLTVQADTTDELALTGRSVLHDGARVTENTYSATAGSPGPDPVFTSLDNANLMGVLCFSVILGLVLSAFRDEQNVVLHVFVCLSNTLMTATHMLLWFAPIGLCSASVSLVLLGAGELQALTGDLSMYVMAFMAAVALHSLLVLPTLYLLLTRHQLGPFFRNMVYPMSVALGTSSSSATAPTLIVALEQGLRMDPRLARFLAPVGATMNMDGTAIYFIVTVLFFAQKNAIALTVGQHLVVGLMCCLATLSTSPSPQAGRVVLVYLMTSLGIPLDGVGVLLYTDWIMCVLQRRLLLNRLSTAVNVLGDAVVASGTQELCRATLPTGRDEE